MVYLLRKMDHLALGVVFQFYPQGPGRPSAGGPRMDRRVVTSSEVVNVSRLASRHQRSAQLHINTEEVTSSSQDTLRQLQKVRYKTVINSLPDRCSPKLSTTACQKGAVQNCDQMLAR